MPLHRFVHTGAIFLRFDDANLKVNFPVGGATFCVVMAVVLIHPSNEETWTWGLKNFKINPSWGTHRSKKKNENKEIARQLQ